MLLVSQDTDQLHRESLQCSWTSILELSADGPQTAGLVMLPFWPVVEDIFNRQWDQSTVLTLLRLLCYINALYLEKSPAG